MPPADTSPARSPVAQALAAARGALVTIVVASGLINLLMLTGSLFMMQVYDRVLSSQSVPTLIVLSLIATAAYLLQGGLDVLRSRLLALLAEHLDASLGPRVHAACFAPLARAPRGATEGLQPFRDLEAVRGFLAGPGPLALADMPWLPIYLAVLFMLHPALGWLATNGALALIALTALTEAMGRRPIREALLAQSARNLAADGMLRGSEAVRAMGLLPALSARWQSPHDAEIAAHRRAAFITGGLAALSRALRMILQSGMLGLGAWLAIKGQISSGAIIAGTILASRALAPIDLAIGGWRGFVAARAACTRLNALLSSAGEGRAMFALPAPGRSLAAVDLSCAAPGMTAPIVQRASLELKAGQGLGIIGPTGSGKTTLLRALLGIWQPLAGKVTLDEASLDQWDAGALGRHVGYLPQDIQLFDGTIAQNIARFEPDAEPQAVLDAARAAGLHDMVVALKDGYQARVGAGGVALSAGQRQRIGLARALYRDPFIVALDEPNSNLDAEGEAALIEAIRGVRKRQGIVLVIAHRPSVIAALDTLLVMKEGRIAALGPRDEVLGAVVANARNIVPHPAAARAEPSRQRAVATEGA